MASASTRFVQAWGALSMLTLAVPLVVSTSTVNPAVELDFLKKQLAEGRLKQPTNKCIPPLGCFPIDGEWSQRSVNLLPAERAAVATTFLLITRQNLVIAQHLHADDAATIERSHFVKSRLTKFIVHGYLSSAHEEWVQKMADELLKEGDYNVIRVNWSGFTGSTTTYIQATANIRIVGAEMALLMRALVQTTGAKVQDFHIIGHSLGAHAAGYAGQSIKGIGRITGLDPAGPLFEGYGISLRLDPSDASFVDVIHTDGDNFMQLSAGYSGFGLMQVSGHADFYPNGGMEQPGCDGVASSVSCDHLRAVKLFISSINSNCTFLMHKCDNYSHFESAKCSLSCTSSGAVSGCNLMGLHAIKPAGTESSAFYGYTTSSAPYCATAYSVKLEIDSRSNVETGSVFISLRWPSFASPLSPLSDGSVDFKAGSTYSRVVSATTATQEALVAMDALWQPEATWWFWLSGCGLFGYCRSSLAVKSLVIQRQNSSSSSFCATGFKLTEGARQRLNRTGPC